MSKPSPNRGAVTRPAVLAEPWVHASGAGPPAVLVHGVYPGSPADYAAQQPLADTFQLLAVDRRGYGANPDQGSPLGWPADCADLLRLLEATSGAHLVGHSYGGAVVGLAASRRPDLVRSLTLVDPTLHAAADDDPDVADMLVRERRVAEMAASAVPTREWAKAWVTQVAGADEAGAETFLGYWGEQDLTMLEVVRREQPAGAAPVDWGVLAQATFPKNLVLGGTAMATGMHPDRQHRLARALARALTARIGAEVTVFDHSSHFAPSEEPTRFNELLRTTWLGQATRQGEQPGVPGVAESRAEE